MISLTSRVPPFLLLLQQRFHLLGSQQAVLNQGVGDAFSE